MYLTRLISQSSDPTDSSFALGFLDRFGRRVRSTSLRSATRALDGNGDPRGAWHHRSVLLRSDIYRLWDTYRPFFIFKSSNDGTETSVVESSSRDVGLGDRVPRLSISCSHELKRPPASSAQRAGSMLSTSGRLQRHSSGRQRREEERRGKGFWSGNIRKRERRCEVGRLMKLCTAGRARASRVRPFPDADASVS